MTVRLEALRHLAQGRQGTSEYLAARMDAMQGVRSRLSNRGYSLQAVKTQAAAQLVRPGATSSRTREPGSSWAARMPFVRLLQKALH